MIRLILCGLRWLIAEQIVLEDIAVCGQSIQNMAGRIGRRDDRREFRCRHVLDDLPDESEYCYQ